MNTLILKNQTSGSLSYVNGNVTVAELSALTVPLSYVMLAANDINLRSDVAAGNIVLNDGIMDRGLDYLNSFIYCVPLDMFSGGSISAFDETMVASTVGCSTVTFTINGTYVATLVFEATQDGLTWNAINGILSPIGSPSQTSIVSSTTITSVIIVFPCSGFQQVRARANSYTSGNISISWEASQGVNAVNVFNTNPTILNATANIQDSDGNSLLSINNQLKTRDVIDKSFIAGVVSVGTTPIQAMVGNSPLVNRKFVLVQPLNGTVYKGSSSSITSSTGAPIITGQVEVKSFTDNVSNWYLVSASGTVSVYVEEGS